jgi:hypothetical protein
LRSKIGALEIMRIEPNSIPGIGKTSAASPAKGLARAVASNESPSATETVELTELASLLAHLAEVPSERGQLLTIIRQRLAEGYYDSESLVKAAAEQLADSFDWLAGLPAEHDISTGR